MRGSSSQSQGSDAAVAIRRYVNDEIAETAERFDAGEGREFEFVCECGNLACEQRVWMTLVEYEASGPGSVVAH